jgi:hypothetical protein
MSSFTGITVTSSTAVFTSRYADHIHDDVVKKTDQGHHLIIDVFKKRLPGVRSEPGASFIHSFHFIFSFSPLYR